MPIHSFTLLTVSGIKIRIDATWLLIAALLIWAIATGFLPQVTTDLDRPALLGLAIIAMLGFFVSLILHELSHALVARKHGVEVDQITLFLLGGMARIKSEPTTPDAEMRIAIAGPLMSFGLGILFWLAATLVASAEAIAAVLVYLALANMVLAVFNLLPAYPMDGGRVLRAAFWRRSGDILKATQAAARISLWIGLGMVALGVFQMVAYGQFGGAWMILLAAFVMTAAQAAITDVQTKTALKGQSVADLMSEVTVTITPHDSLFHAINEVMLPQKVTFVPVVEGSTLLGYIDSDILRRIETDNWVTTQVGDVFAAHDASNTVDPSTPASDLLTRMAETGQRKFLVVKDGNLVGVITLTDMLRLVGAMRALGSFAR